MADHLNCVRDQSHLKPHGTGYVQGVATGRREEESNGYLSEKQQIPPAPILHTWILRT